MDLMSCRHCGVVLDKSRIMWREAYDHDTGEALPDAKWDHDRNEHVIPEPCPVCGGEIYEEER